MVHSLAADDHKVTDPIPAQPVQELGEIGLSTFAPYLMNRIMGRYNDDLRKQMSRLGLSTPKMRALAILSVIGGLQMSRLSVYAVVEQSTLSRAMDALVTDGMVRRETDPDDQRASRLYITREGRETFAQIWPHMEAGYQSMFDGISDSERTAFVATLQTILTNVRQHDF